MGNNIFIVILVCLLAGIGAGLGTGFAGMSACAIIGPMLVNFLGVPTYQAVGIGLASDVLASAFSAATYYKNKNLDIKHSYLFLITVLVMTVVGSLIARLVPEQAMGLTMEIFMIFLGLKFLIFPVRKTKTDLANQSAMNRIIKSIIGGVVVGFICGFVGAGGGMMMLLILTAFLGYEIHMAVGTSVLIMSITALTGSISHFVVGGIYDPLILCLCMVFTLIFAFVASLIANKSSGKVLNRVVGVILIITSIAIICFDIFFQ